MGVLERYATVIEISLFAFREGAQRNANFGCVLNACKALPNHQRHLQFEYRSTLALHEFHSALIAVESAMRVFRRAPQCEWRQVRPARDGDRNNFSEITLKILRLRWLI